MINDLSANGRESEAVDYGGRYGTPGRAGVPIKRWLVPELVTESAGYADQRLA